MSLAISPNRQGNPSGSTPRRSTMSTRYGSVSDSIKVRDQASAIHGSPSPRDRISTPRLAYR